jgi:hypothetical protein
VIYRVVEEVWSIEPTEADQKLLRLSGAVDAGDKLAAEKRAEELASTFALHGQEQNARYPYWWGRNIDERVSHRYVVKPVGARHPNRCARRRRTRP